MNPPLDALLLSDLLSRHGAVLALYARQWTDAAEDCVQEAFVEFARQATPPDSAEAWLYRVVRNRALNAARSERRRKRREQQAAERRNARSPQLGRESAEQAEAIDELSRLAPLEREIVVLRVWGQLGWEEIAAIVGGSKSAAQRRYVAALEAIRSAWDEESRKRDESCRTK